MFVEGFKESLRYAGSIGERTFGIDAYLNWPRYTGIDDTTSNQLLNKIVAGGSFAALQFALPGVMDHLSKSADPANRTEALHRLRGIWRGTLDGAYLGIIIPALVYNPVALVIFKLAVNIGSHVCLDIFNAQEDSDHQLLPL